MRKFILFPILFLAPLLAAAQDIGAPGLAAAAKFPSQARTLLTRYKRLPANVVFPLVKGVGLWPKANVELLCQRTCIALTPELVLKLAKGYAAQENPEPVTLTEILAWAKVWWPRTEEARQAWLNLNPKEDITPEVFKREWDSLPKPEFRTFEDSHSSRSLSL